MSCHLQILITSCLSERLSSINQQTSAGRDVEKGNPSILLVGIQTGADIMENSMEFHQKIKNGTAFDSEIPLLEI